MMINNTVIASATYNTYFQVYYNTMYNAIGRALYSPTISTTTQIIPAPTFTLNLGSTSDPNTPDQRVYIPFISIKLYS